MRMDKLTTKFQQALAEIRTDLDAFSADESSALMACGYQMAAKAFERQLAHVRQLWDDAAPPATWPFEDMRVEITSTAGGTPRRDEVLAALRAGSTVRI